MSFVCIDGPNGSGKTTLVNSLSQEGFKTLSSPNGTDLAKMLRPACRGTKPWEDIDPTVQFLLFSAARLDEYIRCVKDSNEIVVADRWWTSTYVYQCVLQEFSTDFLEYTIDPEEYIDLVILLDAKDEILLDRTKKEREKNPAHGRCSWTQQDEIIKKIADIYRNKLPHYLETKFIPCEIIDSTEGMGQKEVLELAKEIIKKYVQS